MSGSDFRFSAGLVFPMPPVFNGAAAAGGQLFLALEGGAPVCVDR